MILENVNISDIIPYEKNPRKNDKAIDDVIKSIKAVGYRTPITVDENNIILTGHTRYKAIKKLGWKEIPLVIKFDDLSEKKKKEYRVLDNKAGEQSEWDFNILESEFTTEELASFGFDFFEKTETEKLSELEYESIYYEPEKKPEIQLSDCLNLEKFNDKLKALDDFDLTDEQKDTLKMFAYRFIKIDFENVANYYFFNASDEEKKAIERLRLVLSDTSLDGFIEDDLLKIYDSLEPDISIFENK